MRLPEERTPLEILRDMSDGEIHLAAACVLPLVACVWAVILGQTIPGSGWFLFGIRLVLVLYLIPLFYYYGVQTLRRKETEREKLQRDRKILISRLICRKSGSASFERLASIESSPSRQLDEQRIRELLNAYPGYFASCTMKGKDAEDPGRPGIKLVDLDAIE